MDSTRKLAPLENQRGLALVYIALLMVAICGFLGLAVDIGYMYVARGQLQNAADSAALAGASALPDQTDARGKAKTFAEINSVVPGPDTKVAVSSDDITLGNWNRKNNPAFNAAGTPVNAVKVETRRTEGSIGGPVDLFFSRIINDRWSRMGVSAFAIAQRTPKAGFYFLIGRIVCNSSSFPVFLAPQLGNMAWTSLLDNSTNTNDTKENFICPAEKLPDVEVCGQSVYTTNGTASSVFQGVEIDFYDPEYDKANKTFDAGGNVDSWTIIVPVSTADDPSIQPSPQPVWGYARIVMTRACGAGGGNSCPGRSFTAPPGVCAGGENDIVISSITCIDCENSSDMLGARPSLVQ